MQPGFGLYCWNLGQWLHFYRVATGIGDSICELSLYKALLDGVERNLHPYSVDKFVSIPVFCSSMKLYDRLAA